MSVSVLCSGWYATASPRNYQVSGEESIRGAEFRPLWWHSIERFVRPARVLIVDSNSPIQVDDSKFTSTPVEQVRLTINPGHSQTTVHHFCGWSTSVLIGLEYTLASDADYFLYVEQDALIFGEDFVQKIEDALIRHRFIFGKNLQQSVFAIRKDAIRPFLSCLHGVRWSDRTFRPELKFFVSCQRHRIATNLLQTMMWPGLGPTWQSRVFRSLLRFAETGDHLPFGYGRDRPINFGDKVFYFQHGSASEIESYRRTSGFIGE